jgi:DNA-binding CsgD family transcriptional regulator
MNGNDVRGTRRKLKLTQTQLASRLFVSRETVARWESGVRKPQRVHVARIKELERSPRGSGPRPAKGSAATLNKRDTRIIQLIARGKRNREVAEILDLSRRTIENHRARIMRSLGLRTFSDLVVYAVRAGMIE